MNTVVVSEDRERQMRAMGRGRITRECNDVFNCSCLREYAAFGSSVLHAFGKRAIVSCDWHRLAVDFTPGLQGGIVQQLHDTARSNQIAPGKSRAVAEHNVAIRDAGASVKIRRKFHRVFARGCARPFARSKKQQKFGMQIQTVLIYVANLFRERLAYTLR